jgi:hypothetical protein
MLNKAALEVERNENTFHEIYKNKYIITLIKQLYNTGDH